MSFWSSILGDGDTPPPVFWKKSLQSIENKENETEKESQESSRGDKPLGGKEIEESGGGKGVRGMSVVGGTPMKRWRSKYSRAMIGQII